MIGAGGDEEKYLMLTPRLALRRQKTGDDMVVNALSASPAIAPNLTATIPAEAAETIVIVCRDTHRVIGAGVSGMTGLGSGIEVSLWIGEPDWSVGYATEAAHALIDRAFADERVAVVWCSNRVTNTRARRVIEKCGFQFRGNGMVRLPGRGAFPIERFALDRRNWTSLKSWGANHLVVARGSMGDAPRETAA